jgi:protein-tyrosine-phosphatase/DNA-binding MarR family transcriptional regulator
LIHADSLTELITSVKIEAMNVEWITSLEHRAAVHAALGDPGRLRIVDTLRTADASPSELADALGMSSNLLAHHLKVLESRGLVVRRRSEGDQRRSYVQLAREVLGELTPGRTRTARRVLFVCTANTVRSHLAVALWHRASHLPAASAGTHPAERIDPRALAAARRRELPMRRLNPRRLDDVFTKGDLLITVCDLAHEELGKRADLHWSIPDPVRVGTDTAFDEAVDSLGRRIDDLAPMLSAR